MSSISSQNHLGIDPSDIIGKVLRRVRKSSTHPALTIDFADETLVQVRIDGYDPQYPGLPKTLETDAYLQGLISSDTSLDFPVLGCAYVTLSDRAFERRKGGGMEDLQYWDQQHRGLALKFVDEHSATARWHCIWAVKEERDETGDACIFRSYEDVYIDTLPRVQPPPSPNKHRRRKSRTL